MPASATVVCLNTSRHHLHKLFHGTGLPKLMTGCGTDLDWYTLTNH